MQQTRPLAAGPGDQILEAVIPLVVDGETVRVTVISTWQSPASSLPRWIGAAAALVAVLGAWSARQRVRALTIAAVPLALAALVVGAGQFVSLPASTDPSIAWWVLPAVAVVSALAGVAAAWRRSWFWAQAAVLVTGVELAVWAWSRRSGLSSAIIPTDLPGWFDRLVTATALVGGAGLAVAAAITLFVSSPSVVSASTARSR